MLHNFKFCDDFDTAADYIAYLLKNKETIKAQIKICLIDIAHESVSDAIEAAVFHGQDYGELRSISNKITDNTAAAAEKYRKDIRCTNTDIHQIKFIAASADTELRKLDICVYHLEEQQSKIIHAIYYEKLTWKTIRRKMHVSDSTIYNTRGKAIEAIANMFSWQKY